MKPRWWWFVVAATSACALLILFAHPFLAITRTTGSNVLVVEGWLDRPALDRVVDLVRNEGYSKVYTTGIVCPSAYHLHHRSTLEGLLREPMKGELELSVAGLPGAYMVVVADHDTLLKAGVEADLGTVRIRLERPVLSLKVLAIGPPATDPRHPVVFIGEVRIDGRSWHHLAREMLLSKADGHVMEQGTTFADRAARELMRAGLPDPMVTSNPTFGEPDQRTWRTASNFVDFAKNTGLRSFDVVTLGVHARRTRGLYRRAAGDRISVGIISLPDRWCRHNDWWLPWYGWVKVLKEIAGAHQPYTAAAPA